MCDKNIFLLPVNKKSEKFMNFFLTFSQPFYWSVDPQNFLMIFFCMIKIDDFKYFKEIVNFLKTPGNP